MTRTRIVGMTLALVVVMSGIVSAQMQGIMGKGTTSKSKGGVTTYYDNTGKPQGWSRTENGQTNYYDNAGKPLGWSRTENGQENYYTPDGKPLGWSQPTK